MVSVTFFKENWQFFILFSIFLVICFKTHTPHSLVKHFEYRGILKRIHGDKLYHYFTLKYSFVIFLILKNCLLTFSLFELKCHLSKYEKLPLLNK